MRNIITALFILLISGCSHKVYMGTRWQNSEIKVDGKEDDWDVPLKEYDKTAQLNYEVSNDRTNLYFAARTTDKTTIQKIMMAGLKIEIDTFAKSDGYPFSLKFPVMGRPMMGERGGFPGNGPMGDFQGQGDENSERPQRPDMNQPNDNPMFMEQQDNIQLFGFNDLKEETSVKISDASGIRVKCERDSLNVLFYEAVIPFNTFYNKENITPFDTLGILSFKITLESTGMPGMGDPSSMGENGGRPDMGGGRPSMGGGGAPPMGGGGPGGGPGGAPGGGPGGGMNQNSAEDDVEISFELHLSYN